MTTTQTRENGRARAQAKQPQTLEEHLEWVEQLGEQGADLAPLAQGLLREKFQLEAALGEVRDIQGELREKLEALTAPQLYPAVITDASTRATGVVEVYGAGMTVKVSVHPDIAEDQLRVGAQGILVRERNCLLEVRSGRPTWNEVGSFEGYVDGRQRALLRYQEEMMAVTLADELKDIELKKGDLLGFNRDGARLAYTRVEPPSREHLFFEDTPPDRFEELGGLDKEIALLQRMINFRLLHAEVAQRYRLPSKHGILFEGPPGNGKTKMARCLANYVAGLVPSGKCRFMAVSGSSDYSMWLGQSEQKLIARFEAARQLASDGGMPVVMFFDEIDALGRRRGSDLGSSAPDRILATFLSQLDGIKQVANLIVIGATNRADVLDSGLTRPGRLGDVRIRLSAPNRQAARAIVSRYLGNGLPLGDDAGRMTETLLSRLYAPQSDYAELVRVTLRDGRKVAVGAKDLVSGALLENLVRSAAEEAAEREMLTGMVGVTEADLMQSLERAMRGLAMTLTPANVRSYTTRLPQDVDPVGLEMVQGSR
jgi:proteasome-associated ATPase